MCLQEGKEKVMLQDLILHSDHSFFVTSPIQSCENIILNDLKEKGKYKMKIYVGPRALFLSFAELSYCYIVLVIKNKKTFRHQQRNFAFDYYFLSNMANIWWGNIYIQK